MNDAAENRLFRLRTPGDPAGLEKFYTGRVTDCRQVLAGWGESGLVVLYFDDGGEYLEHQVVPAQAGEDDGMLVLGWQRRAGFTPRPIAVQHFYLTKPVFATLRVLPDFLLKFLCDPYSAGSPDRQEHFAEELARWRASESFVLHWGEEKFFCAKDMKIG